MKILVLILLLFLQSSQYAHANISEPLAYAVSYEQAPPVDKNFQKKKNKRAKRFKNKQLRRNKNKPSPNQTQAKSKTFYVLAIIFGALLLVAIIAIIALISIGGSYGMVLIVLGVIGLGLIFLTLGLVFLGIGIGLRKNGK